MLNFVLAFFSQDFQDFESSYPWAETDANKRIKNYQKFRCIGTLMNLLSYKLTNESFLVDFCCYLFSLKTKELF